MMIITRDNCYKVMNNDASDNDGGVGGCIDDGDDDQDHNHDNVFLMIILMIMSLMRAIWQWQVLLEHTYPS